MQKSYFDLSQGEVDSVIKSKVVELSTLGHRIYVYEIGCGGKSTVTFAQMLKARVIDSYEGDNIEQKGVNEARGMGLNAKLVGVDYDHNTDFKGLKGKTEECGVVAMFGLPEIVPEAAKHYEKQAKDLGLKVISYPEIK